MCTREMTLGEEIINLAGKGIDIPTVERMYRKYIGLDEKGNVTLSVLYQFQETGVVDGKITGKLEAVHSLKNCEKLKSAGIVLSS